MSTSAAPTAKDKGKAPEKANAYELPWCVLLPEIRRKLKFMHMTGLSVSARALPV